MTERAPWPAWLDAPLDRGLALRAHALLVHAPGALGQFDLALALADGWLCESPRQGRACGQCTGCRLMDSRHPDFHVLLPEALRLELGWEAAEGEGDEAEGKASKAKPSREIRIDALRAAIDWAQKTAARGGAKVLVIHPSEAMNPVTANALLKTLEEPPGRLRLVLTAGDPEALLPTLRSRCQRLAIELPQASQARVWLEAQGVAHAEGLLAAAGGQPHAALALHREGIDAAAWSALPGAVRRGQSAPMASWPVRRVVEALHKLCHDLLAALSGGAPRYFAADALAPALRPCAPSLSALLAWQRTLLTAAQHEDHPWHAPLRVDALVAQAAALWQTPRGVPSGRAPALDTLPKPT
jgi:DNA polymerase-3 subunit delta'